MAEIQSITFSQNQSLAVSKTVSATYEKQTRATGLNLSIAQADDIGEAGFGGILDVIDVSDDARQKLLQDRADAENLAAYVRGERPEVLSAPLVIRNGRVEIDALAAQISEQFSFTETYELSFLQEASLEIETDEGSIEITQSRLVEASFSASVSLGRELDFGALQTSISA